MKRSIRRMAVRVLFGAYLAASGGVILWATAVTVAAFYYLITT